MSGRPLDWLAAILLHGDRDYCVVAQSWAARGGVGVAVSTVFLVMTTGDSPAMPPLFETMLFLHGDPRYPVRGHDLVSHIVGYKAKAMTYDEALANHVAHLDTLRAAGWRLALPAGRTGDTGVEQAYDSGS